MRSLREHPVFLALVIVLVCRLVYPWHDLISTILKIGRFYSSRAVLSVTRFNFHSVLKIGRDTIQI